MADYGVNIAVAVKNSQAITKLSKDAKTLSGQIDNVNKNIEDYANLVGKAVVNSTANFSKALQDAAENLNKVALNGDKATRAARDFLDAQLLNNEALEEQKRLLREVFLAGKPLQATPFGPQPFSPQKQLADEGKTRARLLAIQADKESGLRQERFQATSDFLNKMHSLEISLGKKANSIEIDNIIKEFEIKERLEKEAFDNARKLDIEQGKDFDKRYKARMKQRDEDDERRARLAKRQREEIMLTGQASPIGGAVGIPGSPAALRAAERAQRVRSAQSSALIGGAFPLLFGQGPAASIGGGLGGFGGGMMGGELGFGLSLLGTTVGAAVDAFAERIKALGDSLTGPVEVLEALEEAGAKVPPELKATVDELLEVGKGAEASKLALEEFNNQLGPNAAAILNTINLEMEELTKESLQLEKAFVQHLGPAIVGLISLTNLLSGKVTGAVKEKTPIRDFMGSMAQAAFSLHGGSMIGPVYRGLTMYGTSQLVDPVLQTPEADKTRTKIELNAAEELMRLYSGMNDEQKDREKSFSKAVMNLAQEVDLVGARLEGKEREIAQQQKINNILDQYGSKDEVVRAGQRQTLENLFKQKSLYLDELELRKQTGRLATKADRKAEAAREKSERAAQRANESLVKINRSYENRLALQAASTEMEVELLKIDHELEAALIRINKLRKDGGDPAEADKAEALITQFFTRASSGIFGDLGDIADMPSFANSIEMSNSLLLTQEEQIQKLIEKYPLLGQAADAAANMMTFGIQSFVDGTKTAEEVFADFLRSIADMLMRTAQQMIAQYIVLGVARAFGLGGTPSFDYSGMDLSGSQFGPGALGGFPIPDGRILAGRANGGSVSSGRSYLVGERGPELFVPGAQGNIVPNNAMGGVNVGTINISVENTGDQLNPKAQKQIAGQVQSIVLSTLANERRSGGML